MSSQQKLNSEYISSCAICDSSKAKDVFVRPDGLGVYECLDCGLAYVSPRPTKEEVFHIYENTNTDFKVLRKRFYEQQRVGNSRSILRHISKFKELRGSNILDIGCGPGFLLYEANRLGANVMGLELSKTFVSFGRNELGLDIHQGILEQANLPQEKFDIIICNDLIEHLSDPSVFFAHVRQLLVPGGILHILTPNYYGTKECGDKWPGFYKDFEHIFYFNSSSLSYALEHLGLKPVKFFYLPQKTGLKGKNVVCSKRSTLKSKVRDFLLSIPFLNRQIWRMLSWIRTLSNWKSIKSGTAFEMGAIFKKPQVKKKYK